MQSARRQLTGKEALQRLLDGNKRFLSGKLEHPNHCEESRKGLVSGQEPIAVVLTCADSRVPPVDVFDQGLGDIFVVRVAGNIINDHILGSIEYAVSHLHTPLVMVMGHSSCGAVTAVAQGVKLSGHIASLTPSIDAALKKTKGLEGHWTNNAAKELAVTTARKIEESEPIVADLVKEGRVLVVATYYDLESGEVSMLSQGIF
ncbi:carbonic anhydrase [Desulfobulbus propionicus DSM 2032]|jgi:carbonic anhydrase|uniref:Carbonic anhydrase n=1 Tax=Desulfobulbus propionicus (strain ATCC 33891 / DSM 2032 / VKM B-1956 / 1pr3) TaxID=577650 RepID=A0A7U4DQ36_DESPD|nr:carbonic anhydrase [Desulfobulbus propionicus]ADW18776.1 carbonic anhydrase [Desulfobulbus propionicus DSM 2032]